jgi:hypothetical protein
VVGPEFPPLTAFGKRVNLLVSTHFAILLLIEGRLHADRKSARPPQSEGEAEVLEVARFG